MDSISLKCPLKPTSSPTSPNANINEKKPTYVNSSNNISIQPPDEMKRKKRKQLETLVTAGCGYGRAKKRTLESFWTALWPKLVEGGWAKVDGTRDEEGLSYFVPPGGVVKYSKQGKGYYEKIKDVITRVNNKEFTRVTHFKNETSNNRKRLEVEAADAFRLKLSSLERKDAEEEARVQEEKRNNKAQTRRGRRLDCTSWKYEQRKQYPKVSSRVGPNFQATNIPEVENVFNERKKIDGEKEDLKEEEAAASAKYDQVWCSKRAEIAGNDVVSFMENTVPCCKKEAAMVLLHERNYTTEGLREELNKLSSLDGSNWTQEEKENFHKVILETHKNLDLVTKRTGKSLNNCLTYYLGRYKQTKDYKILKSACIEHRKNGTPAPNDDVCGLCGDGGRLLCCDSCDNAYHLECLNPRLTMVPEGGWDCDSCVSRKFLQAGKSLLDNLLQLSSKHMKNTSGGKKIGESVADEHGSKEGTCKKETGRIFSESPLGNEGIENHQERIGDDKKSAMELHEATQRFITAIGRPFQVK